MGYRLDHTRSDPAVFDTNIWVHGLTENVDAAAELVDAAVDTQLFVSISAYIFEETRLTFENGIFPRREADAHLTDFSSILYGSQNIDGPTSSETRQVDVDEVRNSPEARAFGAATDCQAKDAPVLWHGHALAQRGRSVTIYTNDREFSQCSPPPVQRDGDLEVLLVE